jgi:hypothetical protein
MEWMLDIQLGRRNLSPIQRIAVTEKYRPIYEKQAKENSLNNLKQNQTADKSNLTNREFKSTNKKLADIAGVKPTTYKMGAKVLNSDNEDLKQRVLSGETSISAGYKNGEMGNGRKKEVHNGLPTQLTLDQIAIKIIYTFLLK